MGYVSLRDENAARTRRALLRAARKLFVKRGYTGTSVDEVAEAARVTRGALYHHFAGKRDLFQAVLEELDQQLLEAASDAAAKESDPWKQTLAAVDVFFEACLDPALQRIAFQEAPIVLGWEAWRELENRYFLGKISRLLDELVKTGSVAKFDTDLLAHVLLSAATAAALVIARADDVEVAREEARRILYAILGGLKPSSLSR